MVTAGSASISDAKSDGDDKSCSEIGELTVSDSDGSVSF